MKKDLPAALILTMTLAACTQTPPSQNPGGSHQTQVTKQGDVTLVVGSLSGVFQNALIGAGGGFRSLSAPATPTTLLSSLAETCFIQQGSAPGPDPTIPTGANLNAGAALTLKAAGPALASLTPQGTGVYVYAASSPFPTLPPGVTLDVPGASGGFPAFAGVAFPALPAAVSLSVAGGGTVTSSSSFSWPSPSDDANTLVVISGVQPSPAASFLCFARDDGGFAFPDRVKADLATAGFVQGQLNYTGRFVARTQVQGDAALNTYVFNQQIITPGP